MSPSALLGDRAPSCMLYSMVECRAWGSRTEASESKNPLGDALIGQNNDFTRGWTSNIMPWGMLRE